MERNLPRDRSISLRKKVIISTVLTAFISAGANDLVGSGHEIKPEIVYPPDIFTPVTIQEDSKTNAENMTYSNLIVELPSPFLSKEKLLDLEKRNELEQVINIMKDKPGTFSNKYIEDIKMYYPIYKEVADKYDIDWYLLFIVHEKETGASAGDKGFAPDSYYKGAMQRDPNIWSESYVDNAAKGLEDLKSLPQRHKDDWREIAAAGNELADNQHQYERKGYSHSRAVLSALLRYSAQGPAMQRFDMYKEFNGIFSNIS